MKGEVQIATLMYVNVALKDDMLFMLLFILLTAVGFDIYCQLSLEIPHEKPI